MLVFPIDKLRITREESNRLFSTELLFLFKGPLWGSIDQLGPEHVSFLFRIYDTRKISQVCCLHY